MRPAVVGILLLGAARIATAEEDHRFEFLLVTNRPGDVLDLASVEYHIPFARSVYQTSDLRVETTERAVTPRPFSLAALRLTLSTFLGNPPPMETVREVLWDEAAIVAVPRRNLVQRAALLLGSSRNPTWRFTYAEPWGDRHDIELLRVGRVTLDYKFRLRPGDRWFTGSVKNVDLHELFDPKTRQLRVTREALSRLVARDAKKARTASQILGSIKRLEVHATVPLIKGKQFRIPVKAKSRGR